MIGKILENIELLTLMNVVRQKKKNEIDNYIKIIAESQILTPPDAH